MMVRVEDEEGVGVRRLPRTSRLNREDITLGELLIQQRMKKATDPRDKVYSLLGMVATSKQKQIPVYYGLDMRSLF